MQYTISNTDELLLIYGINFSKNRESHRHGDISSYGSWRYYVNDISVNFWSFDIKTGQIEIIDIKYSEEEITKRYNL